MRTTRRLRRLLAETDPGVMLDRTWLDGATGPDWAALRARLAAMPRPVFPLEGRDVLALGLPPGPQVGALLRAWCGTWWLAAAAVGARCQRRAEGGRLVRRARRSWQRETAERHHGKPAAGEGYLAG